MADLVRVEGLREVQRALRSLDPLFAREMRNVAKAAGAPVLAEAKSRAPVRSGRLRKSLVLRAEQRGASIKGGGKRVPYYGFIDFGGSTGRGHTPGVGGSGAIKRPFRKKGRIIYPALDARRKEMLDIFQSETRA